MELLITQSKNPRVSAYFTKHFFCLLFLSETWLFLMLMIPIHYSLDRSSPISTSTLHRSHAKLCIKTHSYLWSMPSPLEPPLPQMPLPLPPASILVAHPPPSSFGYMALSPTSNPTIILGVPTLHASILVSQFLISCGYGLHQQVPPKPHIQS